MKDINEIVKTMNFPIIKDMFGNEVRPGDVIAMTNTGSRKLYTWIVTDQLSKTAKQSILLLSLTDKWTAHLDVNELHKATTKCYSEKNLVKLTNNLPQMYLDIVKNKLDNLRQANIKKAKDNKNKITGRISMIVLKHKKTGQYFLSFPGIESQPGKVLGKKQINNEVEKIYNKYAKDYKITFITDPNNQSNILLTSCMRVGGWSHTDLCLARIEGQIYFIDTDNLHSFEQLYPVSEMNDTDYRTLDVNDTDFRYKSVYQIKHNYTGRHSKTFKNFGDIMTQRLCWQVTQAMKAM